MDVKALFKVQCGLFVAAVGLPDKMNGCITNTLLQQTHVPVKFSVTLEKNHLTHDMVLEKGNLAVSALSKSVTTDYVKRFGFVSGREVDKFGDWDDYEPDGNGNPLMRGGFIAAAFSLAVYGKVDLGTHTLFLCNADGAQDADGIPITYWDYRESLRK